MRYKLIYSGFLLSVFVFSVSVTANQNYALGEYIIPAGLKPNIQKYNQELEATDEVNGLKFFIFYPPPIFPLSREKQNSKSSTSLIVGFKNVSNVPILLSTNWKHIDTCNYTPSSSLYIKAGFKKISTNKRPALTFIEYDVDSTNDVISLEPNKIYFFEHKLVYYDIFKSKKPADIYLSATYCNNGKRFAFVDRRTKDLSSTTLPVWIGKIESNMIRIKLR